jgi:cytochrome c553
LDGNNLDPGIPKLAGQLEAFLVLQLRNYKSGERPHPVMAAIATPLSEHEIRLAARHYARQPPMRHEGAADPALLKRGEAVFIFRIVKPGAPACQYCHGAAGQGVVRCSRGWPASIRRSSSRRCSRTARRLRSATPMPTS